jgi:hypothetical protein
MNERVQQNMNKFQELAKKGASPASSATSRNSHTHDGLTKGIRTKEDAAIFMTELNVIK